MNGVYRRRKSYHPGSDSSSLTWCQGLGRPGSMGLEPAVSDGVSGSGNLQPLLIPGNYFKVKECACILQS